MTIKDLREKYNLTQSALARSLGVSSNAISGNRQSVTDRFKNTDDDESENIQKVQPLVQDRGWRANDKRTWEEYAQSY